MQQFHWPFVGESESLGCMKFKAEEPQGKGYIFAAATITLHRNHTLRAKPRAWMSYSNFQQLGLRTFHIAKSGFEFSKCTSVVWVYSLVCVIAGNFLFFSQPQSCRTGTLRRDAECLITAASNLIPFVFNSSNSGNSGFWSR